MRTLLAYLRELFAKEADCYLCEGGYVEFRHTIPPMKLACHTCRGTGKLKRSFL